MALFELSIREARRLMDAGEISSVELTESVLDRILEVDNQVKAYLTLLPEEALEQASMADKLRAAGESSPLLGIPVAIKDAICVKGAPTTCGSRILEGFIPPYDATVIEKLRAAGAVILGKTNLDEFAMGSSTENSAYFPTHNPWDLTRVPGGSSGGSAAAVAAQEALAALGSDTGGSVRQPAAFCGVVGIKPTYGRVSRCGLVAFASSLDQIGTFGREVADAAAILNVVAGYDPQDSTSMDIPVPDYGKSLIPDLRGIRVGVPQEYFVEGMDAGVERVVREAIATMQDLGAEIGEVSLPHTKYALPTFYLLAPAEASANLARYDGVKYGLSVPADTMWEGYRRTREQGFGAEVKRRIMLGTYALSAGYYDAYYLKAQKVRTLIKQDFEAALEQYDVLAAPTAPVVPFKIGERVGDPLQMYLTDIHTLALSLAGMCGIAVPCGMVDGLPVGLQIMGGAFQEPRILQAAYAFEQATPWHTMKPALKPNGAAVQTATDCSTRKEV